MLTLLYFLVLIILNYLLPFLVFVCVNFKWIVLIFNWAKFRKYKFLNKGNDGWFLICVKVSIIFHEIIVHDCFQIILDSFRLTWKMSDESLEIAGGKEQAPLKSSLKKTRTIGSRPSSTKVSAQDHLNNALLNE